MSSRQARRERKATAPTPPHPGGAAAAPPLERWLFLALLPLLALPPFFKGLYFPQGQLTTVACAALLFAAAAWSRGGRKLEPLVRSVLDGSVLALALSYVLSLTVAVDPRAAIQWTLVYIGCFFVYWMVSRLAADERRILVVLRALAASSTGVALIGLAAGAFVIRWAGSVKEGRLFSTFQYPNTTAAFLSGGLLLLVNLWSFHESERDRATGRPGHAPPAARGAWRDAFWPGAAYAAAGFLLLTVIAFTRSRGAWLLIPPLALVNLWLAPPGQRLSFCTRLGVVVIATLAAVRHVSRALTLNEPGPLVPALLLAGVSIAVTLPLHRRLQRAGAGAQTLILAAIGVFAAAAAAAVWMLRLLPQELFARRFSTSEYSAWARVQWTRDALRALGEHLPLGVGGGGWSDVHFSHQSYGYVAKHVHNHFVEIPLETGIPGTLAFAAIWLAAAVAGWQTLRRWSGDRRRWLVAGTLSATLLFGLHSAMDFNLALAAFAIALWTLFGCISAMSRLSESPAAGGGEHGREDGSAPPRAHTRHVALAGSLAALAVCALALSLLAGYRAGQRGAKRLLAGENEAARAELLRARRFDPWTASFAVDLAAVEETAGRPAGAERLLLEAIELNRWNPAHPAAYARFLLRQGRTAEGLGQYRRAIDLQPFFEQRYEDLARAEYVIGARAVQAGRSEEGRRHLESVIARREEMRRASMRQPVLVRQWKSRPRWRGQRLPRLPEHSMALELDSGRASLLLGRPREAVEYLERAAAEWKPPAEVHAWLAVALQRAGDARRASEARSRAIEADPRRGDLIRALERFTAPRS